jgi:hypothetical protein
MGENLGKTIRTHNNNMYKSQDARKTWEEYEGPVKLDQESCNSRKIMNKMKVSENEI